MRTVVMRPSVCGCMQRTLGKMLDARPHPPQIAPQGLVGSLANNMSLHTLHSPCQSLTNQPINHAHPNAQCTTSNLVVAALELSITCASNSGCSSCDIGVKNSICMVLSLAVFVSVDVQNYKGLAFNTLSS